MFHDVPIPQGQVVIVWATAFLYGMLLLSAVGYLCLLLSRGVRSRMDRFFFALVVFQTLISGFHMALQLQLALHALFVAPNALVDLTNDASPSHVAQVALYLVNAFIADSVLVWRLYVVYNKAYILCIPFALMVIGSLVTGGVALHVDTLVDNIQALARADKHLAVPSWSLSVAIQVSASCLIAYRVWMGTRATKALIGGRNSRSMSVAWVVLESGAVLSISTVILLALFVEERLAGAIVIAINAQLAALVPTSILLRVELKKAHLRSPTDTTVSLPSAASMGLRKDVEHPSLRSATVISSTSITSGKDSEIELSNLNNNLKVLCNNTGYLDTLV